MHHLVELYGVLAYDTHHIVFIKLQRKGIRPAAIGLSQDNIHRT